MPVSTCGGKPRVEARVAADDSSWESCNTQVGQKKQGHHQVDTSRHAIGDMPENMVGKGIELKVHGTESLNEESDPKKQPQTLCEELRLATNDR